MVNFRSGGWLWKHCRTTPTLPRVICKCFIAKSSRECFVSFVCFFFVCSTLPVEHLIACCYCVIGLLGAGKRMAEEGEEEEDDTPYDKISFPRIPEEFLSVPEIATKGLQPASPVQFDGQLAVDNEWEGKDEGKGDKNTHL